MFNLQQIPTLSTLLTQHFFFYFIHLDGGLMTVKTFCSFMVVLRTMATFSNIQVMEKEMGRTEKHQGHKDKKKDGETDDKTYMKGLYDFIIHVT